MTLAIQPIALSKGNIHSANTAEPQSSIQKNKISFKRDEQTDKIANKFLPVSLVVLGTGLGLFFLGCNQRFGLNIDGPLLSALNDTASKNALKSFQLISGTFLAAVGGGLATGFKLLKWVRH